MTSPATPVQLTVTTRSQPRAALRCNALTPRLLLLSRQSRLAIAAREGI